MSSSSVTSGAVGERGIPSKCVCGLGVTIFTAKTQDNPGRPFFRCESKKDVNTWTNKRDGHLFKWVEDAVFEEVEDALPRLAIIANEISKTKAEVSELIGVMKESKEEELAIIANEISKTKAEVNELIGVMKESKEEEVFRKKELNKCKWCLKVCVVWLGVITIVLGYVFSRLGSQKKLVFGS